MKKVLLIFLFSSLFSHEALAVGYRRWSFYGQYNYYEDILNDSSNQPRELAEDISLNLDFRMHRIFILILHGGQSLDGDRSYWGLGFKVDLPGIFMLGGNVQEFIRKKKRRGINTSVYWKTYVVTVVNQGSAFVGNRFGFSTDFLISKQSFINLDLGLYSSSGNQYFSPSLGLGYEF